jgi:ABC-2 type transport system permease protein
MLPLMIPLFTMNAFITEPNGGLAVFLSLFPLTAPIAMMTRLAATNVPWWQLALAFAGLTATTYLFILIAARFFRADNLLSLAPLRWQGVVGAWRRS